MNKHNIAIANTQATMNRANSAKVAAAAGTGYVVAAGHCLSTPRGLVDSGKAIGPLDFETEWDFETRLESGHIVAIEGEQ